MQKFEYHVVINISETHLDEMGMMGWELISIVHDPNNLSNLIFYFRRILE